MANSDHVRRLLQGVEAWNTWRRGSKIRPDLSEADLSFHMAGANAGEELNLAGADLSNVDFRGSLFFCVSLQYADLTGANLGEAELKFIDLRGAEMTNAYLSYANVFDATLDEADLSGATLAYARMQGTSFCGADLTNVRLQDTIFSDCDLGCVTGLEECLHLSGSTIDFQTLQRSGQLPLSFLRGVGLPDALIHYLPSLINQAIQHYSCFISYSSKDHDFAARLHADLQENAVRCWFAPHDMPIGGKILDEIDAAIKIRDKVLLILSENSIKSDWVEDEVTKGFEEERRRGEVVLFPIRLDDAVMETKEAWAVKLRARHIGDFSRWMHHDAYQKGLKRVLRDLAKKALKNVE